MRLATWLTTALTALLVRVGGGVRDSDDEGGSQFAVYLNGSVALRLDDELRLRTLLAHLETQREEEEFHGGFRLALTLFPEGGQMPGVAVLELADVCGDRSLLRLSVESSDPDGERDLRLGMRVGRTTAVSELPLRHRVPLRVQIVARPKDALLIVDGARVARTHGSVLPLFLPAQKPCLKFFLGTDGNHEQLVGFRGGVRDLELQRLGPSTTDLEPFVEPLTSLARWHVLGSTLAVWESFQHPFVGSRAVPALVPVPRCGFTECDNRHVLLSYASPDARFRSAKTLRYRLVVVAEDDGSHPLVTPTQIDRQHVALQTAFAPYNLSFELNVTKVHRSDLRRKVLIFGCSSASVGDGVCQSECRLPVTGDDGGDCGGAGGGGVECHPTSVRDGHCDPACNVRRFHFDGGDCCREQEGEDCIDPDSPLRNYMTPEEFKTALGPLPTDALPVYFANWPTDSLIGLSTFPWEAQALTALGGIILQPHRFGLSDQLTHLTHEIGHTLGLWHVHHGVTEVACDDPCFEEEASFDTGDLLADTPPMAKSTRCDRVGPQFVCGRFRSFRNAPVSNYMSYSGNACSNHFTPQQTARMHCYADLKWGAWRVGATPSPHVPVAPRIVPRPEGLEVHWPPALDMAPCRPFTATSASSRCAVGRRFVQYAHRAASSDEYKLHGFWRPSQATGPPDAELCSPSVRAWLPDTTSCDEEKAEKCVLHLWPEVETVVERVLVWFTWNAANGIRRIHLIFGDDSEKIIEDVFASCDHPYSFNVYERKTLKEIQVLINNPFVSVDAIEMTSVPDDGQCNHCAQPTYVVQRKPDFAEGVRETMHTRILDTNVDLAKSYEYAISVISVINEIETESQHSPFGQYLPFSASYCGDGVVASGEACDDGNLFADDGCSAECTVEVGFRCSGSPSLCYVFANDGVCEESERAPANNPLNSDCAPEVRQGIEVPPLQFRAFAAPVNGPKAAGDIKLCVLERQFGRRKNDQCSHSSILANCTHEFADAENFTLTLKAEFPAVFPTALLVSLGAVQHRKELTTGEGVRCTLAAVFEDDSMQDFGEEMLRCGAKPVKIGLLKYLTGRGPLRKLKTILLKNFHSQHLVVEAMMLEVDPERDLWTVRKCSDENALYDPHNGVCVPKASEPPICPSEPNGIAPMESDCANQTICQLQCPPGHVPNARLPSVVCKERQWSAPILLRPAHDYCAPVDCGEPTVHFGIAECLHGTRYARNCTISCSRNYLFVGNPVQRSIQCQANGEWTEMPGFCLPTCNIDNLAGRNISQYAVTCRTEINLLADRRLGKKLWPVHAVCRSVCKENFLATGSEHAKVKFVCGHHGDWLGPTCQPAQCPKPKTLYTGLYNCTDEFNIGSDCSYQCPGHHAPKSSRCLPNGQWSVRYPCTLNQKLVCPVPQSSEHLIYHCSKKLFAGQSCSPKCAAAGYDVVREDRHQLPSNQVLLHLTPTSTIFCTASTKLHPDPESLKCVRSCNKAVMGDGWCDFQNNRAYCHWDGGDCCSSTSRSGRVRYMFPSLCTNAFCQCLDPNANENLQRNMTNHRLDRQRSKRLLAITTPAAKRHWIEKLFHWLDAVVSESNGANSSSDPTTNNDLVKLADELAFLNNNHSNHVKYAQLTWLNAELRWKEMRKAMEAIRRALRQTAMNAANTNLLYKTLRADNLDEED